MLLLSTMLGTVSALLRSSTVEYYEDCPEFANIFMLCVGESGCGKSPACNQSCIKPVIRGIENDIDDCQLIIDDNTEHGIFQSIVKTRQSYVPIIAIDEAHEFMKNVVCGTRRCLNVQKMCRLYDGGWWSISKGSAKRQRIEDARVSVLLFTTPVRFKSEVWDRVVKNRDGLDDRFLLTYVGRENVSTESRMDAKQRLRNSAIKQLDSIYQKIFNEHEAPRTYKLSEEARKRLIAYDDEKVSGDWGSKVIKNALKLVVNFHVLYFRLQQALDYTTEPTPTIINHTTMDMALTYLDILLRTSVAARSFSSIGRISSSVPLEIIIQVMLNIPGPFVTARRAYMKCPSNRRPVSNRVQQAFEYVSGTLGTVKKVNKSPVFFKALPSNLTPEILAEYNMSLEVYTDIFKGSDELLTKRQIETFFAAHPFGDAYHEYVEGDTESYEEGLVGEDPPPTP